MLKGNLIRCGELLLGGLVLAGFGSAVPVRVPQSTVPHSTSRAATTTTAAPATSAADGNNVAACAGGNCEVNVGLGPIMLIPELSRPPLTIRAVLVQEIDNGTVIMAVGPVSLDQFRLACSGGSPACEVIQPSGQDNAGTATGGAGTVVTANELTIRVEAVTANSAILKLSTGS